MNKFTRFVAVTIMATLSTLAQAADMTEEEAIEKALALHPGTVEKAYQETKKGVVYWEVKITDENGQKWEIFYDLASGEFASEEKGD